MVVGGIAYGFQLLYELQQWFVAVPLGGLLLLSAVATLGIAAYRVVASRRRASAAGGTGALSPMGAPVQALRSPRGILVIGTPRAMAPGGGKQQLAERLSFSEGMGQSAHGGGTLTQRRSPGAGEDANRAPFSSPSSPTTPPHGRQQPPVPIEEAGGDPVTRLWHWLLELASTTTSINSSTVSSSGGPRSPSAMGGAAGRPITPGAKKKKAKASRSKVRHDASPSPSARSRSPTSPRSPRPTADSPRRSPGRSPKSPRSTKEPRGPESPARSPGRGEGSVTTTKKSPRRAEPPGV